MDEAEGDDLDEGEKSEGAQGTEVGFAQGGVEGGGVEKDPGRGGEEKDAEIVPPGGDVAVVLVGDAAEDVEVEVLVDEGLAEAVQKVEVPGEGEREEDEQAEEEMFADAAAEGGVDSEEGDEGEEDGSAGGAFAHEGDGEAEPVEIPAAGRGSAEEFGKADEGEEAAEGEEGVGFADAGDVEETEGGEEDERAEPGGEAVATEREPAVQEG